MSLFQIDDVLSMFQFMASFCLLLQNFGFRLQKYAVMMRTELEPEDTNQGYAWGSYLG